MLIICASSNPGLQELRQENGYAGIMQDFDQQEMPVHLRILQIRVLS